MAITRISNNVILDGTILPAKLNISSALRTFLGSATSTNLASAVSGTTGSGNLVFAISPTLTTPTISRSGSGTVVTFSDGTGRNAIFETATFGMQMTINATGGTLGAYNTLNGQFEAWCNVIANSNTTGLRYMRFGNRQDRFSVQRLNDAGSSITSTPFSFANNAPSNSFYMESDGRIGFGTATPNASAIIDLTSTTQGFLPPRMTVVQRDAIVSAAEGLVVYSTDAGVKTLSLHNGTAWGNVLTTHAASFTSDTLAAALSDESGTSGGFTRAVGATHTSPIISTALTLNATSYSYGAGAREAMLNSMSNRFVYKDGLIPYAEMFEDFPHFGNLGGAYTIGTHGWQVARTAGTGATNAWYNSASTSSSYRAYGVISCTTANTIDAINSLLLGPYNGPTPSPYGTSIQACFAMASTTQCRFYVQFSGGGSDIILRVNFYDGTIDLLRNTQSPIVLVSGLSLSAGDFISGTRYRIFFRPISTTQTEVYFASSPWNSSTWTTLVNQVFTHTAYSALGFNNSTPYVGIQTIEAASKTAYIDWVAIRQEVQR